LCARPSENGKNIQGIKQMTSILLGWDRARTHPRQIGFVRQQHGFQATGEHRQQSGFQAEPDRTLITDDSEGHILVASATGSGKGRAFGMPNLLTYQGGVVALDPKGELVSASLRQRQQMGPVAILDPFGKVPKKILKSTDSLNPLSLMDAKSPTIIDDCYAMASLFSGGANSQHDGEFWNNWGADMLAAFLLHAVAKMPADKRNFGAVFEMLNGTDGHLSDVCGRILHSGRPLPFTRRTFGKFIGLFGATQSGVSATTSQMTRILAGSGIQAMLKRNTINPAIIRDGGAFTIFLVLPHEKLGSHGVLVKLLFSAIVNLILSREKRPEHPTLLLVDEASQIGRVPALVSATTLGRGYGLRIAWLMQSVAQFEHLYGAEAGTIFDNCGIALTLGGSTTANAAESLSRRIFGDVTPAEILALGADDGLLRVGGQRTRVIGKLDYLKDEIFAGLFDPNPLHER
jgi:type IV secretion system protein VirD4